MSVVKLLDRYLPNLPPRETSDEMREYLRDELDLLKLTMNASLEVVDALRTLPRMFLLGDADDFTLDTTDSPIVNYDDGGALGNVPIEPNPLTGEITIPLTGAYRITAYIIGIQGSVVQNESILLRIGVNAPAIIQDIYSIDVATNQTSVRSLAVTFTRSFLAGDVVTMHMIATAAMGLFAVAQTSFELTLVAVPAQLLSGVFQASTLFRPWDVTPATPPF